MNTIGVLLLAAATATTGIGKPHAGGMGFLRGHVVQEGAAPPGGMMAPGGGGMGCQFGHPGCAGGATCPGGGAGGGGVGGAGGQAGRRFPNTRSQVYFVDPPGMKIGWQTTAGGAERVYLPGQLTVPARYNFNQGYIYRLKLSDIPGRPGLQLYPTIEVAPSTPATDAFLTHNPVPAQFTPEDFDQVTAGNFVTKVIYLPDPRYQELAIAGVETLVSTRLEPGVDPVLEADRRGTILMIIRLGAIDLEMQNAGALAPESGAVAPTVETYGSAPGTVLPPGSMPTGVVPPGTTVLPPGSLPPGTSPFVPSAGPNVPAPAMTPAVPVDTAPVSPPPPSPEPPAPAPAPPETPPAAAPAGEEAPAPADPAAPPAEVMPAPTP